MVTIGLIVGGTRIQPVHFDVAETERNRGRLKEALLSAHGPATLLLSLGEAIRIAVRKESVQDMQRDGGELYCSIVGGRPGERILVVEEDTVKERKKDAEESRAIVVLQSKAGFVLRGDFTHAGAVAVVNAGAAQMQAWKRVQSILMPLVFDEQLRNEGRNKVVFHELCDVKDLQSITRLHFMIVPKKMPNFFIEDDRVGIESEESSSSKSGDKTAEEEEEKDDEEEDDGDYVDATSEGDESLEDASDDNRDDEEEEEDAELE